MATILLNLDNINVDTLNGLEYLKKTDCLTYLYCEHKKLYTSALDIIDRSGCEIKSVKLPTLDKKSLNSYISSYLGYAIGEGCRDDIMIISNDPGCQAIIDFWKQMNYPESIVVASTIEKGFKKLNSGENKVRIVHFG